MMVGGLEVVVVEVAGDGRAELDALEIGGPEVDAGALRENINARVWGITQSERCARPGVGDHVASCSA